MTTPLAETLATLPSGAKMPNLSQERVENYLRTNYIKSRAEAERRLRHKKRQELYSDGGVEHIDALIDQVYAKAETRERIKAWARVARFDNPLKRVVNELSTVYQKKASRTVTNDAANAKYQELQRLCKQHRRARQINRLLNVHRALFVGFRVREADKRPAIDIITPDQCFAVTHPNDATLLVALVIEVKFNTAIASRNAPRYVVWTEHESFYLTEDCRTFGYETHGFGRIPYVHLELEPATCGFWPGEVGEDLVGAAMSAWFANANLLKETKSATKFPVVQGDMSTAARDQAADSDEVVEVPEGTAITTVDNSMDLGLFRGTSDHVIEHAANNYGMSGAYIKHQGVQSAEAREVLRAPMKELREEQIDPLEEFERELGELQVIVLKVDAPELAFDLTGWAIKFADNKTPLAPKARLELFEHERRLGLTNTITFLMETQGITEDQAWEVIAMNIVVELLRNELMRPLQAISGSPGAATPGTDKQQAPQQAPQQGEPEKPDEAEAA